MGEGEGAPAGAPDPLTEIKALYHFTDVRNLPLIIEHGLLPFSVLRERGIEIPAPGGNDWSRSADEMKGMERYVHLCFLDQHPMEYRAREEGRILDSVFLQIDPEVLRWKGVAFTVGVANKSGVEMHTIEEAASKIDYEVLYRRTDWKIPEIQARRQLAEKSEILVPDEIPLRLIKNMPTAATIEARIRGLETRLKEKEKEKQAGG